MKDKRPTDAPITPDVSEIIDLAWDDFASFDDIEAQTGLKEKQVIAIMRKNMKPSSFRMWRARVTGRKTKHKIKHFGKDKAAESHF